MDQRIQMSIIQELDNWLKDSEIREKEININETTIVFTKLSQPSRVNVSVVRSSEEVSSFYFYLNEETPNAASILRCYIQAIFYNIYKLNSALGDIKSIIGGDE